MYVPRPFEQRDIARLHDLVEAHPLGLLIVPRPDGPPETAHVPFLLDRAAAPCGRLLARVARRNPAWQAAEGREAVVVFQGPHAYVSPRWYASRADVPTWSYAVAQARGVASTIEDPARLRDLVGRMAETFEAGAADPWSPEDLPAGPAEELLREIVGIEITVSSFEGKWKLGQNRSREDRARVVRAFTGRGGEGDLALAGLMAATLDAEAR